jgi:hypothetical protein
MREAIKPNADTITMNQTKYVVTPKPPQGDNRFSLLLSPIPPMVYACLRAIGSVQAPRGMKIGK